MSITTEAFAVEVSPELLGEALAMFAEMPAEDRQSFEVRSIRLFELLDERAPDADIATLAFAIQMRLEALAGLAHDRGLSAWTLKGDQDGMEFIHADVVAAAAREPLIEVDGRPAFDAHSLRRALLETSEAKGSA